MDIRCPKCKISAPKEYKYGYRKHRWMWLHVAMCQGVKP